jgi:hypothetical protein
VHSARHADAALEISRAAEAHAADVVALSFSVAFPQRQIGGLVNHLRQTLAPETALRIGGGGIRLAPQAGVALLPELPDATRALQQWRSEHP